MNDDRISWVKGDTQLGPLQTIGVLEIREDGSFRAVFAERAEVDGRCHVLLAKQAWGGKDSLETRWWSLELDERLKVVVIRNGSCGDALRTVDAPRIIHALDQLRLSQPQTMIAIDDGPAAFPWFQKK
jgi:hypothetical protein